MTTSGFEIIWAFYENRGFPSISEVWIEMGSVLYVNRLTTSWCITTLIAGIELYVAAVYNAPGMGEVNGIASDPDNEHVVMVPDADAVQQAASHLLDLLCA